MSSALDPAEVTSFSGTKYLLTQRCSQLHTEGAAPRPWARWRNEQDQQRLLERGVKVRESRDDPPREEPDPGETGHRESIPLGLKPTTVCVCVRVCV